MLILAILTTIAVPTFRFVQARQLVSVVDTTGSAIVRAANAAALSDPVLAGTVDYATLEATALSAYRVDGLAMLDGRTTATMGGTASRPTLTISASTPQECREAVIGKAQSGDDPVALLAPAHDCDISTTPTQVQWAAAPAVSTGSVTLDWLPLDESAMLLSGYRVAGVDGPDVTPIATTGTDTTEYTVAGLTPGVSYEFQVAGYNAVAEGDPSAPVQAVPVLSPGTAVISSAVLGSGSVTVSFTAEATEARPVDGVRMLLAEGQGAATAVASLPAGATTYAFTGLTPGTQYTVGVEPFHTRTGTPVGAAAAAEATVITIGAPGSAPLLAGDYAQGDPTGVVLAWSPLASTSAYPVDGYNIYRQSASSGVFELVAAASPATAATATVTGLATGVPAAFQVSASNAAMGLEGPRSNTVTVTPIGAPGYPHGLAAEPGDAQVVLSWAAPAGTGGSPVTGYSVQRRLQGGAWETAASPAATTATVTGLANGSAYEFHVAAVNAAGTGTYSTTVAATPLTTPGAVTSLTAVASDRSVSLSWAAPAGDGGSPVTDYLVRVSSDGGAAWSLVDDGAGTAAGTTVTGLANGTAYRFTVDAVNAAGTGTPSAVAGPVTPLTVPGTPTGASAVAGNAQAAVSWTAPATDGGSAITGYAVTSSPGSLTCATTGLTCAVTGLANDTAYSFTVRAANAAGTGAPSSASGPVTPTLPFNAATGGTVTTVSNYNGTGQTWKVHTFASSGSLSVTSAARSFTVLAVGGGGVGSGYNSYHGGWGGGGGGGRVVEWADSLTVGSFAATVGGLGGQSQFNGQTAPGGGNGGGAGGGSGSAGGSGGGGGGSHSTGGSGGAAVPGSPRAGYGNPGGNAPTGGMAAQAGGSSTFDSRITGAVTRPGQGGGPGANGTAGMVIVAYRVG
jgi:hypothetical protein